MLFKRIIGLILHKRTLSVIVFLLLLFSMHFTPATVVAQCLDPQNCLINYCHNCNPPGFRQINCQCSGGTSCSCGPGHYCCVNGTAYGGYGECCPVGVVPTAPPGGGGGCAADIADDLQVDWNYSPTEVLFSWKPTGPLRWQAVYVSGYPGDVEYNCKTDNNWTSQCIINDRAVPVNVTGYIIDRELFEGGRVRRTSTETRFLAENGSLC